ncbi:MAG: YMGG-like glycine zipper-containing protein [Gammaproteobacteria bacterium]
MKTLTIQTTDFRATAIAADERLVMHAGAVSTAGPIAAGLRAPLPVRACFALRQVAGTAMLASLLACGSLPGERAISGAGIGAGAGAAVGAVTGMGVGTGAAIGAAAGAAAGGLTKEEDVDLGKPVWK